MKITLKLRKWWHKFTGKPSFRAIYTDGNRTCRMDHWQADQLAQIFGGTVIFEPTNPHPEE